MADAAQNAVRGSFFWTDVMRFCAAFAVVAEHARDLLFLTNAEAQVSSIGWKGFYFITGFGHEAVMVFFVLSGFWITAAIDRRAGHGDFWPNYLIDRLSRLLMVVVPALLIGGLLDLATVALNSPYAHGLSGALSIAKPIPERLGLVVLAGNLAFLQGILVPTFGSNGPLWSLACEFWYYFWFPALLLAAKRRRFNLALLTLGVGFLSPMLFSGFAVWLMGSSLYYLDRKVMENGLRSRIGTAAGAVRLAWLGGAGGLLILTMSAARLGLVPHFEDISVGAAFAVFLWVMLRLDPRTSGVMAPVARYGAKASFSLYAVHFPLIVLLATLVPPGQRAAPDGARLALFGGVALAAVVIGWAFSLLTEYRTLAVRARLRGLLILESTA